jgi:hypothetical protein
VHSTYGVQMRGGEGIAHPIPCEGSSMGASRACQHDSLWDRPQTESAVGPDVIRPTHVVMLLALPMVCCHATMGPAPGSLLIKVWLFLHDSDCTECCLSGSVLILPSAVSGRPEGLKCHGQAAGNGNPHLLNDDPLMSEFMILFSLSHSGLLHCDFPTLIQFATRHGIIQNSWTHQELRPLIVFHIMMGMCAFEKGIGCKALASGHHHSQLRECAVELLTVLCERGLVATNVLRFICNAVGLRMPPGQSLHDSVQLLVSSHTAFKARPSPSFDLLDFLCTFNNTCRHALLVWCSGHGIYCKALGPLAAIRWTLIEHVVRRDCCSHGSSRHEHSSPLEIFIPSFCDDVLLQIRPSLPDADLMAFVLSLACLSPDVHTTVLKCIIESIPGLSPHGDTRTFLRDQLKLYVYGLRKGMSVYQTVLRSLFKNNGQFTELNRAANLWPHHAEQEIHERIKASFEAQLLANASFSLTCASCSVHYTSRGFTHTSASELDLAILEKLDDWAHVRPDCQFDGPLARLLLDHKGVFIGADEGVELSLCNDCLRALE